MNSQEKRKHITLKTSPQDDVIVHCVMQQQKKWFKNTLRRHNKEIS